MAKSKISASYDNSAPFYRKLITVGGGCSHCDANIHPEGK